MNMCCWIYPALQHEQINIWFWMFLYETKGTAMAFDKNANKTQRCDSICLKNDSWHIKIVAKNHIKLQLNRKIHSNLGITIQRLNSALNSVTLTVLFTVLSGNIFRCKQQKIIRISMPLLQRNWNCFYWKLYRRMGGCGHSFEWNEWNHQLNGQKWALHNLMQQIVDRRKLILLFKRWLCVVRFYCLHFGIDRLT